MNYGAKALDKILGKLHSDYARSNFLSAVYTPGNVEVANRSLESGGDWILDSEFDYARKHGLKKRAVKLGKRIVDHNIENGSHLTMKENVIGWKDEDIAAYAISALTKEGCIDLRESAAEIALAFNRKEEAERILKEVLKSHKSARNFLGVARTLEKCGRYDEAIDNYLKCGYAWLSDALKIAKEHSPTRIEKVAKAGVNEFENFPSYVKFYVQCAKILGETERAKKNLLKFAKKIEIKGGVRVYSELIESLMKFGATQEASEVVNKIEESLHVREKENGYADIDSSKQLIDLYKLVGRAKDVKRVFSKIIDDGLKANSVERAKREIKNAIKSTGDKTFRKKELEVFELCGNYIGAERLARELGDKEMANAYRKMQEMVDKAKLADSGK